MSFIFLVLVYGYDYFILGNKTVIPGGMFRVLQIGCAVLILAGILFKIENWPFGTHLLLIGFISLFSCFVFDWISEEKDQ